ncbi:hypothetical protein A2U01_0065045, partial [Trifolium medium]|nr:hypothetical protein [Trifolium medium]
SRDFDRRDSCESGSGGFGGSRGNSDGSGGRALGSAFAGDHNGGKSDDGSVSTTLL